MSEMGKHTHTHTHTYIHGKKETFVKKELTVPNRLLVEGPSGPRLAAVDFIMLAGAKRSSSRS